MSKKEQLQIIIASYYKYWGEEVAELLDFFEEVDQRRIVQMFMNVIEGGHYSIDEDCNITITLPVAEDIREVVRSFIMFYKLDALADDAFKALRKKFSA